MILRNSDFIAYNFYGHFTACKRQKSVSIEKNRVGSAVGKIFSINTIGTVIGVILTPELVFIPYFGIKRSFEIGIAINFLSSIILLLSYNLY